MVKKLPFLLLMAAPYFIPVQSKANWLGDVLRDLFGHGGHHRELSHPGSATPPGRAASGNAVPLDGGTVFLLLAGLGLGAKMLYDAKAQKEVAGGLSS